MYFRNVSVDWDMMKFEYEAIFRFGEHFVFDFAMFVDLSFEGQSQQRHLQIMFTTKCQVQHDRTNIEHPLFICRYLQFVWYLIIETSSSTLRPLFLFLCLINQVSRRYVSCMYTRSYREIHWIQWILQIQCIQYIEYIDAFPMFLSYLYIVCVVYFFLTP